MTHREGYPVSAEEKARQTLDKMASALAEAVVAVEPANSAAGPLEIFPEPGERRADTEFSLPPEKDTALRVALAKLGIGRETNENGTEVGLVREYVSVIEGGQAHKMLAELNVALTDENSGNIIIAATPDRKIPQAAEDKVGEREITAKILRISPDEVGATEYDVALQLVSRHAAIEALRPLNLAFGYDIECNINSDEGSGQLAQIGMVGDFRHVYLLRIDRDYPDLDDPKKYVTLGPSKLMKVVDGIVGVHMPSNEIGFVTSATYQPSREIDAVSVMLELERQGRPRNIGVMTYGTHELAKVKGESPSRPSLGQLAGEAHKAAVELEKLRQLLEPSEQ